MINQLLAAASNVLVPLRTPDKTIPAPSSSISSKGASSSDKASFSTLAAQLNENATRAAARDARMSHTELGKYGLQRVSEFLIETKDANSCTRAMQVPKSNDPELLDRARKASEFVTRTLAGDKNAKSPFENLSREQLNLIVYDESGNFTLNERRAAWQGIQKLDDDWQKTAIAEGAREQLRTGKASRFYDKALEYLKSLAPIDKAVNYSEDAEAILKARIKADQTLPTFPGLFDRQAVVKKITLYDVLAGIVDSSRDKSADRANAVRPGMPPGSGIGVRINTR